MTADASVHSADIARAAVAALVADQPWTDYIAAYAALRTNGPTLVKPPDSAVDIAPEEWDASHPPQVYPCARVDVIDTEEVQGLNHGVGRTRHILQIRTWVRVVSRAATALGAKPYTLTTLTDAAAAFERACEYLVIAHLTRGGGEAYNAAALPGRTRTLLPAGDSTVILTTRTVEVWQQTRSPRFNYAVEAVP